MSTQSVPSDYPARVPASEGSKPASWLLDSAFWGAVSIVAMWLAVLIVGVFGGDINKVDAGGGTSSVPVVVVVCIVAVIGTIAVAHRAFGPRRADKDLRRAVEADRRALEQLTAQVAELRTKLQG